MPAIPVTAAPEAATGTAPAVTPADTAAAARSAGTAGPGAAACAGPVAGALRYGLAALVMLLGLGAPRPSFAATARIQYISSASVYLDAGSAAGLLEGMVVRVERDGKVIAELVVEFVAQNSASCRVQASTEAPRPNDVVTFTPATPPGATGAVVAPGAEARRDGLDSWSRRGRAGVLFLRSTSPSGTLHNPMLWADVTWSGIAERQIAFRFRGDHPDRTTTEPSVSPLQDQTRVYETSLRYRSAQRRLEIEAGRLLPERLELLGSLDGGGLHWRPASGLRLGIAGGAGTDYLTTTFAAGGTKIGGFLETGGGRRWRALVAVGHVEDTDVTRRRFVQVRSDAAPSHRFRLAQNLEVDLAPDWKRDMGEPGVELTAFSLGTQTLVHRSFDFSLGYEARRPLLLPEQRQLPAPEARPLLHGARASARLAFTRQWSLRLGGDVRLYDAGDVASRSWDALLYGSRLGPASLTLHGSRYETKQADGTLFDAGLTLPAGARWRFDLAGGGSLSSAAADAAGATEPESRWGWFRVGADLEAGWGLWLRGAGEWRGAGQGNEFSVELTQQF